ncbi:MAG: thermonuclease family protein [Pseudomonadota bacterium]
MRLTSHIIVFSLLFMIEAPISAAQQSDETPDKTFAADIKHCHDGDTCHIVAENGMWFNARLAGIDAPEVGRYGKKKSGGQPLGDESRDALSELVVGKKGITIRQVDLDQYNRPVIEIFIGDSCANLKLLELGMAERYHGKTKRIDKSKYDAAEDKAKSAKLGIWSIKNYESPSAWRHGDKK